MTRSIKIELELPEFEKELNITVNLRRDGEAINVVSSSQSDAREIVKPVEEPVWKQEPPKAKTTTAKKKSSGNLMDSEW